MSLRTSRKGEGKWPEASSTRARARAGDRCSSREPRKANGMFAVVWLASTGGTVVPRQEGTPCAINQTGRGEISLVKDKGKGSRARLQSSSRPGRQRVDEPEREGRECTSCRTHGMIGELTSRGEGYAWRADMDGDARCRDGEEGEGTSTTSRRGSRGTGCCFCQPRQGGWVW